MKYLAVTEDGEHYIEDSSGAVAYSLVNSLPISYYAIKLDPETNEPRLSSVVRERVGGRTAVKVIENITIEDDGGTSVGSAEVTVTS